MSRAKPGSGGGRGLARTGRTWQIPRIVKDEHLRLLVLGFVMGTAPQFFLAHNLMDFSEVRSAVAGGVALAIAGGARSLFGRSGAQKAPDDPETAGGD